MLLLQEAQSLTIQYRMAADIQLLANTLVYNGQLSCGTEAVSTKALKVSLLEPVARPWLAQVQLLSFGHLAGALQAISAKMEVGIEKFSFKGVCMFEKLT